MNAALRHLIGIGGSHRGSAPPHTVVRVRIRRVRAFTLTRFDKMIRLGWLGVRVHAPPRSIRFLPPACQGSPVGVAEKSSPLTDSSACRSPRFMSYLPLLSFGLQHHRFRFGLSVTLLPLSSTECSLPCRRHDLVRPLLTSLLFSAPRSGSSRHSCSRQATTEHISWCKFSHLRHSRRIYASILDGYGLRGKSPLGPTLALILFFINSHVCSNASQTLASRR